MRIHLAQQGGFFGALRDPWLAEITALVLVENSGVPDRDTVIFVTGRGYFWSSDMYHLAHTARRRWEKYGVNGDAKAGVGVSAVKSPAEMARADFSAREEVQYRAVTLV
jgi:hypothetical protein